MANEKSNDQSSKPKVKIDDLSKDTGTDESESMKGGMIRSRGYDIGTTDEDTDEVGE